jgi:hypothetical protein
LTINTIHFAGSGWLGEEGAAFEAALARIAGITASLAADGHPIAEVNVGGGLKRSRPVGRASGRSRGVRRGRLPAISALGVAKWLRAVTTSPGRPRSSSAGRIVRIRRVAVNRGLISDWFTSTARISSTATRGDRRSPVIRCAAYRDVTVAGHINEAGDGS